MSERGILPFLIATADSVKPPGNKSKTDKENSDNVEEPYRRFYAGPSGITENFVIDQEHRPRATN